MTSEALLVFPREEAIIGGDVIASNLNNSFSSELIVKSDPSRIINILESRVSLPKIKAGVEKKKIYSKVSV